MKCKYDEKIECPHLKETMVLVNGQLEYHPENDCCCGQYSLICPILNRVPKGKIGINDSKK